MKSEGLTLEDPREQHRGPRGRGRVKAAPVLPCHPGTSHLQREGLVVSPHFGLDNEALAPGEGPERGSASESPAHL